MRIPDELDNEEFTLNLTPLIDVVFLLLIFFMAATTFIDPEREIDLELPSSESGSSESAPHELVINVFEDGRYSLAGRVVDEDALLAALKRAAIENPEVLIVIRGDRRVQHQFTVRVMDLCGQAGLAQLAVGTMEGS
ncbi:MAG TPA: biopolymer transporter ExbD [Planctomycetota bacterium]